MPNESSVMQVVAHHVETGATTMYKVDAASAVARYPDEWSLKPWSQEDRSAARERRKAAHDKEVADAKAANLPLPAPLPEYVEPTDAEKAAMSEDEKARAEALALVKAADEKEAKEKVEADKLAAARALLNTAPPQPDPHVRRPLAGAAKALVEAKERRLAKEREEAAKAAIYAEDERRKAANLPALTDEEKAAMANKTG